MFNSVLSYRPRPFFQLPVFVSALQDLSYGYLLSHRIVQEDFQPLISVLKSHVGCKFLIDSLFVSQYDILVMFTV